MKNRSKQQKSRYLTKHSKRKDYLNYIPKLNPGKISELAHTGENGEDVKLLSTNC